MVGLLPAPPGRLMPGGAGTFVYTASGFDMLGDGMGEKADGGLAPHFALPLVLDVPNDGD